jgi:hypothetical protein
LPHYEVIFESGNTSVIEGENDEEALAGVKEQDRRAREGESGGPASDDPATAANWAAERIAKILKYDKHPGDFNPDQTMAADQLKSEVGALIDALADENGVVRIDQLAVEVRGISHPMVSKEHPHDSQYRMKETDVLTLEEK